MNNNDYPILSTYTITLCGGGRCWDERVRAESNYRARDIAETKYCRSIDGGIAVHCELERSGSSSEAIFKPRGHRAKIKPNAPMQAYRKTLRKTNTNRYSVALVRNQRNTTLPQ